MKNRSTNERASWKENVRLRFDFGLRLLSTCFGAITEGQLFDRQPQDEPKFDVRKIVIRGSNKKYFTTLKICLVNIVIDQVEGQVILT
jgi:hypothetical protein